MAAPAQSSVQQTIETVWRMESPRLIAGLVRLVRDVDRAEDLAQEALVAALEHWPRGGTPDKPGAWLMATAKRRAIDQFRRDRLHADKEASLAWQLEQEQQANRDHATPESDAMGDSVIGDDLLRLICIACHPVLSTSARTALTLRLLGGLTTAEIARAFLVPEATLAQRIVRAKKTLAKERIPFENPARSDLGDRLPSILEVIYLIFNEGYTATAGEDWMRPALCEDAQRLGRMLAELTPREPEVHGLVALMEIQASRINARTGPGGEPILLPNQNRALWNQLLIRRGLAALDRARRIGTAPGAYVLQAEIAACHARAVTAEATDWVRIAALYEALARLTSSPVVELNRAVALGMAYGPETGLALVDTLVDEPALKNYHLLPSVRGDFLFRLGRFAEARAEFERAAGLAQNQRERDFLLRRIRECDTKLSRA